MFESWFDAMQEGAPTAWFDPDVDDEFLQSLPPEAWDPPDPDDDLLDPPIVLGTAAATDEALTRLRDTTRWSHVSEARRFEALLLSMDAIHAEHDTVGDPVLTASVLTRGFTLEAGACLLVDPRTVENLLQNARQARATLPLTWAAFRAGDCGWRSVETVFRESVGLDAKHLPEFDQHAAALVGSSTTGRLARDLSRLRERLQADTAVERARCSGRARHVSVAPLRDGQAMLSIVGPSPAIASIYDGLTQAAVAAHGHPDEDRHLGALRHDLAVDVLLGGLQTDPRVGRGPAGPATPGSDADVSDRPARPVDRRAVG